MCYTQDAMFVANVCRCYSFLNFLQVHVIELAYIHNYIQKCCFQYYKRSSRFTKNDFLFFFQVSV